jgi:hypothetical protein
LSRQIGAAVEILMAHHRIARDAAFGLLRATTASRSPARPTAAQLKPSVGEDRRSG